MRDFNNELEDIIAKNLPAQTAAQMSEFIKAAEATSKELSSIKNELESGREEANRLRKNISDLEALKNSEEDVANRSSSLDSRERALDARERGFDMEILTLRVELMQEGRSSEHELVDKVFGHPSVTIKRTASEIAATNYANGDSFPTALQVASEVTRTETKE